MLHKLPKDDLPEWFEYPSELTSLLDQELIDFGPWQLLHGKWLKVRFDGLKKRFPDLNLVPFARRLDSDDIACFDLSDKKTSPKVLVIHDFAAPGWEKRDAFINFQKWLDSTKSEIQKWD